MDQVTRGEHMSEPNSEKKGRYLYAVISGTDERTYGDIGIDEATVYTISDGEMAAVVSDVSNKKIRPERRHLAAHQGVLRSLMEETTPLPMTFGIIADSPQAIQRILSRNQKGLVDQLHRVSDKLEMGLRVAWDVPNIFEYFIHTHQELREARDHFFGSQREPAQEDKIELGRMFDRILNEDRESHTERVEQILSAYCSEIKRNKCRNEREVMNLVSLIAREDQGKFEEAVFKAAGLFDNNFAFDYNGPWAPHNFVDIDLRY
jgi:hypothetical protein